MADRSEQGTSSAADEAGGSPLVGVFLAAAMFVFVIDTSFMNVSISAVVHDLDTTVSGVQAAVAIEALVSAAFILISSKLGDLFGRKRAYTVGLLFYALGAHRDGLRAGARRDHRLLGRDRGARRLALPARDAVPDPRQLRGQGPGEGVRARRGVGRDRRRDRAAVGGFMTTVLSWRAGFLLEAVIIAAVLVGSRRIRDVPYTGDRSVDGVGAFLSVIGMGGLVVGVLVWQEGGEFVAALLAIGAAAMGGLVVWLRRRKREGKAALLDPGAVRLEALPSRSRPDLPAAGRARRHADRAADLPAARLGLQRARGGRDPRRRCR